MKKSLILLCALCVITGTSYAANCDVKPTPKQPPSKEEMVKIHKAREAAFEKKLGLTEEQKVQAREQRKQGFEKMKPIMDKIHEKKQEAMAVKNSELSAEAQEEKLNSIDKEIQELKKQAAVVRKQNMKDFESILTKEQKKTLKDMKKEGRKNFEQKRRLNPPPRPEFEK